MKGGGGGETKIDMHLKADAKVGGKTTSHSGRFLFDGVKVQLGNLHGKRLVRVSLVLKH